jgi:hypothetical protein
MFFYFHTSIARAATLPTPNFHDFHQLMPIWLKKMDAWYGYLTQGIKLNTKRIVSFLK